MTADKLAQPVILGKICGHHGLKGWVKIVSNTRPGIQIFDYSHWLINQSDGDGWTSLQLSEFKQNSKGLIAKIVGFDSREATEALIGSTIALNKADLGDLTAGEYYWLDLIGLTVVNLEGIEFGKIDHLLETGANDVLVVRYIDDTDGKNERLIPWTTDVVVNIDQDAGVIRVDWKEDY